MRNSENISHIALGTMRFIYMYIYIYIYIYIDINGYPLDVPGQNETLQIVKFIISRTELFIEIITKSRNMSVKMIKVFQNFFDRFYKDIV